MARNEYIGIALDGEFLKIAHLTTEKGKLRLVRVDQVTLAEDIKVTSASKEGQELEEEPETESVFGLEEDAGAGDEAVSDELEESLDLLEEDLFEEGGDQGDMVDLGSKPGEEQAQSNEMLLANLLAAINTSRVDVGLNITAGETIFQIVEEMDFREARRKDIVEDVEARLQAIYGSPKSSDNYAFEIRDNGSLLLASHEDEPSLLRLLNQAEELYSGKIFVQDILPDEAILTGLARENNIFADTEITGILEFGPKFCRMIFLEGSRIMSVAPLIPTGTRSRKFLDTIFSKILFQLDTGELPGLSRLILANNTLGEKAAAYFRENFPDVKVEEFKFDTQKIIIPEQLEGSVSGFTTAIGTAWAASGTYTETFPKLSFLPKYVIDRQKVFKLQWHGVLLLLLILVAPVVFNYFYQTNRARIETLSSDLERTNNAIRQVEPTVQLVNELNTNIASLREKLALLDTLSYGTRTWSAYLKLINDGVREVGSTWFTTFRATQSGLVIHGVSLYRDRIPKIVNIFKKANLQQVRTEEMRERTVYTFTMSVSEVVKDKSSISPPKSDALKKVLK